LVSIAETPQRVYDLLTQLLEQPEVFIDRLTKLVALIQQRGLGVIEQLAKSIVDSAVTSFEQRIRINNPYGDTETPEYTRFRGQFVLGYTAGTLMTAIAGASVTTALKSASGFTRLTSLLKSKTFGKLANSIESLGDRAPLRVASKFARAGQSSVDLLKTAPTVGGVTQLRRLEGVVGDDAVDRLDATQKARLGRALLRDEDNAETLEKLDDRSRRDVLDGCGVSISAGDDCPSAGEILNGLEDLSDSELDAAERLLKDVDGAESLLSDLDKSAVEAMFRVDRSTSDIDLDGFDNFDAWREDLVNVRGAELNDKVSVTADDIGEYVTALNRIDGSKLDGDSGDIKQSLIDDPTTGDAGNFFGGSNEVRRIADYTNRDSVDNVEIEPGGTDAIDLKVETQGRYQYIELKSRNGELYPDWITKRFDLTNNEKFNNLEGESVGPNDDAVLEITADYGLTDALRGSTSGQVRANLERVIQRIITEESNDIVLNRIQINIRSQRFRCTISDNNEVRCS
jgi:hypothetical protein